MNSRKQREVFILPYMIFSMPYDILMVFVVVLKCKQGKNYDY